MKKALWFSSITMLVVLALSNSLLAQWAVDKNAREDARYVRVMQSGEEIVLDGVEDEVWAKADSVVVGYGQTDYLPGSGYSLQTGQSVLGDSANAVCKFLYKAPYIYFLYKSVDQSVGGRDWEQSDGIIMSIKKNPPTHQWVNTWDNRVEHFYTFIWTWDTSAITVGEPAWYRGAAEVGGGRAHNRNAAQMDRWMAAMQVVGGTSNDSLPDEGWISEHRMRVDSLNFDVNGNFVFPFSFSLFDGDNFLDSNTTNNRHTKTWWGCEWNENWWYSALFIDQNVTTNSAPNLIPPVDYTVPHLNEGRTVTVDGDMAEWQLENTLHFRAKYGDDAVFDTIRGTGAWASGYSQADWNQMPTVVDGPEMDYYVTYDDENIYVSAKLADQVVVVPGEGGRKDGMTFIIAKRTSNGVGMPILPGKVLTVNIDSAGAGQAGDDLIGMVDTAGVEFALMLGNGTNVNDLAEADSGYTVELKIPFASLGYPENLGDSVVFIGGLVNDIDVFDDVASSYYAKTWWFTQNQGGNNQKAPSWSVLGPAIPTVGVNDGPSIPTSIKLYENYPNPFNPSTTIKYDINVNADVTLSVYNALGQLVSEMTRSNVPAGTAEFKFNAANLSSGVYFYQLKIKNLTNAQVSDTKVNKMVLLK